MLYTARISFDYLNRVDRQTVRPERPEYEIGLSIFIASLTMSKPFLSYNILSVVHCVITNLDFVEETRELLMLYIREAVV
jgi:hypothetical protein